MPLQKIHRHPDGDFFGSGDPGLSRQVGRSDRIASNIDTRCVGHVGIRPVHDKAPAVPVGNLQVAG